MKGIVFNLLAEVVAMQHGEDVWDDLLQTTGLDGVYTSLGSYPDEDMGKLVEAASTMLDSNPGAILRWFGHAAMPLLAERYPEFYAGHPDTRSFLLTLNDIIHPEVKKLYPGAIPPIFEFDTSDRDVLQIGYRSARRLCALAEGFIFGAAAHYRQSAHIEHPQCLHRGDARCLLLLRLVAAE
jgi:hypothetical protein